MTVKISGVLKDGTGKPVQNCTIVLKARRTSSTVVVNTVASENPDEAGRYSMASTASPCWLKVFHLHMPGPLPSMKVPDQVR